MGNYLNKKTKINIHVPQTTKGKKGMKKNDAGGFSFVLNDYTRVLRFLILGTDGGTAYVSEEKHTKRACKAAENLIRDNGLAMVAFIQNVVETNRAIKADESIFCLALCFAKGDLETRKAAAAIFNTVIRTGTHMFQFIEFAKQNGTSGRLLRQTVGKWYMQDPNEVALQVLKYRQRNGWTHLDVLRRCHPNPAVQGNEHHVALCKYISTKALTDLPNLEICNSFIKIADANTAREVAVGIMRCEHVPREFIQTEFLKSKEVWRAMLLKGMPFTAMLRNLGVMTSNGTIDPTSCESLRPILDSLQSEDVIRKSRIHPFSILLALDTYQSGSGVKGSLTWNPIGSVICALEKALMLSFGNMEKTEDRIKIGLDVSGSMFQQFIAGTHITAGLCAAVMTKHLVTCSQFTDVVVFSDQLIPFPMSGLETLEGIVYKMRNIRFGNTDCALPIMDALAKKQVIDTFIILTDNETWFGNVHPYIALEMYRNSINKKAKLIVVGMAATKFSIADPNDAGSLDIIGFDAAAPKIISGFMRGDF